MNDVYFEKRTCSNCKIEKNIPIPKGTTIKEFMKDRKCGNCGCLLEDKKK